MFCAEDVFGGQFCIKDNGIYAFDPETVSLEYLTNGFDGWAKILLEDYQVLRGYPLAHQWQRQVGPIPAGKRLALKMPFVLGGNYEIKNLHLVDALQEMRFRARIATQIKDLPDGAVGSANKSPDGQHGFNDLVDNYAGSAARFDIPTKGAGGEVVRMSELRQISGSNNGVGGVFEGIIDEGSVTHRRVIPGGQITGKPNQIPKR